MIIKTSKCGNLAITKEASKRTCSGFIFTLNNISANDSTLQPFHEAGKLSILEYFVNSHTILFN